MTRQNRLRKEAKLIAKAHEEGYDKGKEMGLTQGALAERNLISSDASKQRTEAVTKLINSAGQFQEAVTRLMMAIERQF